MVTNSRRWSRIRAFLSYYRPYRGRLIADMVCAFIMSVTALTLPLCARYITGTLLPNANPDTLANVLLVGLAMLVLLSIQTACLYYVNNQGHVMGALMEADMRRDLFDHYQRLGFDFYDNHQTGDLMSRLTNDLFWLSELCHHGPEDLFIMVLKFFGVLVIMLVIDLPLALIILLFVPLIIAFAFITNRQMHAAYTRTREDIGGVNNQAEDTLGGIRVVQSFANERVEQHKFAAANERFVDARRETYRAEG
ncbi:MAG: ABC transporter ATP-binding protein, partial [Chloroflexota bacterium]